MFLNLVFCCCLKLFSFFFYPTISAKNIVLSMLIKKILDTIKVKSRKEKKNCMKIDVIIHSYPFDYERQYV